MKKQRLFAAKGIVVGAIGVVLSSLTTLAAPPEPSGSNLVLELESDAGVTDAAGAVSAWADQSGNGNDLVNGGDPMIVATSTPTGEAAIVLDGDDLLERVDATNTITGLPTGADARTMFAVIKYDSTTAYAGAAYGKAATNSAFGLIVESGAGNLALQGYSTDLLSAEQGTGAGWLIQSGVYDGTNWTIYKDDVQKGTGAFTAATVADRIVLGREIGNAGYATMEVAAVLVYDQALSPTDHTAVHDYLNTKYLGAAGNTAPTVTINTPADGVTVAQGASISFDASATDVEDDNATLTAAIEWTSNIDNGSPLNTGGSFSTSSLSVGVHTITATVTDSGSLIGNDSITVTVQAPGGGTAPEPGTSTLVLELESTTGVMDTAGAVTSWQDQSGNGNSLGVGGDPMVVASSTPTGQPSIVLDGDDMLERLNSIDAISGLPVGASERTVVTVVKYDSALAYAGVAYGDASANSAFGTVVSGGTGKLALQGYVTDLVSTQQGSGEGWLVQAGVYDGTDWTLFSDDVQRATGAFPATTVASRIVIGREIGNAGYATMEVAAVLIYDEALSTGELTTVYDYLNTKYIGAAGNVAPVVTINTPSDGSTVAQGDLVNFDATATDAEDDDSGLTAAIEWTSNIDSGSPLNTGGSFSTSTLSPGVHTITATVTDSGLLVGTDSITLTVQAPGGGTAPEPGTSMLVLELESTNGVINSGGAVTSWLDQSGNGNNLVVDGDPMVVAASTPTGQPAIVLDGNDMLERLDSVNAITGLPTGAAERTVVSVVKYDSAAAYAGVAYGSAAANSAFGNVVSGGGGKLALQGYVTDLVSTQQGTGEGWLIQVGTYDGTDWTLFSDNVERATGAFAATTGSDRIVIGREIGNAGYATMEVAAVLIYDEELSAGELTVVYDYLRTKYVDAAVGAPPTVTINTPADGTTVLQGASISFDADAVDAEDDDATLTAAIEWTSNIDPGVLNTGGTFSTDLLSPGVHTITAMVTDSGFNSASDSITVNIDGPPVVEITSPANGSMVASDDLVTFTATADDLDGDLSGSLAWTSDLDGSIGSGASFSLTTLSLGTHTITAEVTDSMTQVGSDSITVTVESSIEIGLISKWELDEVSGTDAPDSVGSNDGGLNAGPIWQPTSGRLAGALELANGDQVVNVPAIDVPGDEMAISVWVKPNSFAGLASEARFVSKASGTGEQDHYWMVGSFTDGTAVRFRLKTDTGNTATLVTGTGKLSLNQWNHIVANYDGSTMKVYVNGVEEGSMAKTGDITADGGVAVGLGNQPTGAGNRGVSGLLDDVRLYGRPLTPTEISDLANPPNQPPTVVISSPAGGSSLNPGDSVLFEGTAIDIEDGDVTSGLAWTSDIDGSLGTGTGFSLTSLSSGVHQITASVSDAGALTGSDVVTVIVTNGAPPPFSGDLVLRLESSDGLADSGGTVTSWQDLSGQGNSLTPSGDPDVTTVMAPSGLPSIYLDGNDKLERIDSIDQISGLPDGSDDRSVFFVANYQSAGAFAGFAYGAPASDQTFGTIVTSPDGFLAVQGFGGGNDLVTTEPGVGEGWLIQSAVLDSNTTTLYKDNVAVGTPLSNAYGTVLSKIVVGEEIANAGFVTMSVAAVLVYDRALDETERGEVQDFLFAKYFNVPPVVAISSPTDASTGNEGDSVTFTATATDTEDGDVAASLEWESDLDGVIGMGATFDDSSLSAGTHVITATAVDSSGIEAEDSVTITVNGAPVVAITAPAGPTTVNLGDLISFTGTADDDLDGDLAASLAWTSSIDGSLGTAASLTDVALSAGAHTITASVDDSGGLTGSATVVVTVNVAPVVAITAPAGPTTINAGDLIGFTGTATDDLDGDLAASLVWTSSIDGSLGTAASLTDVALSGGAHTITASVDDSGGLSGSAMVAVTVNVAPAVAITAPAAPTTINIGDLISFAGTATDDLDGDLSASLAWTSSIDGSLGAAASLTDVALSAGAHTITASVDDSGGLTGSATVVVTVNVAPVVAITAPAGPTTINDGDLISFTGTATDDLDGDLAASLVWTSSIDGSLGTAASLTDVALSGGAHTITASVDDSGGLTGSATVVVTVNVAPVVAITAPAAPTTINDGDLISFTGTATDDLDGDLAASLVWTSSIDGSLGTAASLTDVALSGGAHTITASVDDSGGLTGSATVVVTVNVAPVVAITAPAGPTTINDGDLISFTGTATDDLDGDLAASLVWTSSIDGSLGTAASLTDVALSAGAHTITASVDDSGGLTGSATVVVTVNVAPVVAITAPAAPTTINDGDLISFTGTATDDLDGDLAANLVWTSSIDGSLGTAASLTDVALSGGAHTITASVDDSGGLTGSATVVVTVNVAPVVAITAPAAPTTINDGDLISFTGTATDDLDGDLAASLVWSSSIDGSLGTAASLTDVALSGGAHTITASVDDSGGLTGSATVVVTVNVAPVVAITAPAAPTTINDGDLISFTGTATDDLDGDLAASLVWTSSIDGSLGTAASLTDVALSGGAHTITASVDDSGGLTGSATVVVTVNVAPVVAITAPAAPTTINDGDLISFTGTATDDLDGDLAANLVWTSSIDGSLGTAASLTDVALSGGAHTITASVDDSGGLTGSATVVVTVNIAPVVAITAPAGPTTINDGDLISFTGTATDDLDGDLAASLVWSSSIDGSLGTAASLTDVALSGGAHTITASVDDSGGLTGSATVIVTVNVAPVVAITAPAAPTTINDGDLISFTGTATDDLDGDLAASLVWTSSIDGSLGTAASLTDVALSGGAHTITASVDDSGGLTGSATVVVTVNVAPVVAITAPAAPTTINDGDLISFTGTATDDLDGDLAASLVWTSSIDGSLGTAASLTDVALSGGAHTITASVDDSGGLTGSATVVVTVNVAPVVAITAPVGPTTINDGDLISFTGTATDDLDGDLAASLVWTSSIDGSLGTAASLTDVALSGGAHTITASVDDSGGLTGSASVVVTVNVAPVVAITAPAAPTTINDGDLISFTGTATDDLDGDLAASLVWTSSIDGSLGTAASLTDVALSGGAHTITASVDDSGGLTGSATVVVTVNVAPVVAITAPVGPTTINDGDLISFTGTATDDLDGDLAASLVWTSSIDGSLGTAASLTDVALSGGAHTITASVDDSGGLTGSATVVVTVNVAPVVAITAPVGPTTINDGDLISFTGTATDDLDGDLAASLVWTSSIDGSLGTAASLTDVALSAGAHTITASVDDSGGLTGSAAVVVTVNVAPVVVITAPAAPATIDEGDLISFAGTATDDLDGDLSVSLSWSSSIDGSLGTAASLPDVTLSVGMHTITASVDDSGGLTGSATVAVNVNPSAANDFTSWLTDNGYTSGGFNSDSDGNGLEDGAEYFFNQSPNDASDTGNLPRIVKNGPDLEMHYTRLTLIDDATGVLQISTTLGGWVPAVLDVDYELVSETPSGVETMVIYKLLKPAPAFWRIDVTQDNAPDATFENWLLLNGYTSSGFDMDSDGNGLKDGAEYFFNQSPNDASDVGNLPKVIRNGDDMELHFTRLTEIDDATGVLQLTSNLSSWPPAVLGVDYEVVSETVVGVETMVVYRLLKTGPYFWRIDVNMVAP